MLATSPHTSWFMTHTFFSVPNSAQPITFHCFLLLFFFSSSSQTTVLIPRPPSIPPPPLAFVGLGHEQALVVFRFLPIFPICSRVFCPFVQYLSICLRILTSRFSSWCLHCRDRYRYRAISPKRPRMLVEKGEARYQGQRSCPWISCDDCEWHESWVHVPSHGREGF